MEQPFREVFWNIRLSWLFYLLAAISASIFFYGLYLRAKFWGSGWRERKLQGDGISRIFKRAVLTTGIFRDDFLGGITHVLIMWGFIFLFLGTVLSTLDHWIVHFLKGDIYILYSIVLDIAGGALLLGIILAYLRRYVFKRDRMVTIIHDHLILILLFFITLTGLLVEGVRLHAEKPPWVESRVVYLVVDTLVSGASTSSLLITHKVLWWIHSLLSLFLVAYFPFSKFIHVFAAPVNVSIDALGYSSFISLEEREKLKEDFSWHQLVMLDACTRCNRCQVVCPSNVIGEPLSPRLAVEKIGVFERAKESFPFSKAKVTEDQKDKATSVPGDDVWYCTTCNHCYSVCPVSVSAVDLIREVRSARIESGEGVPINIQEMLESLYKFKNPWQGAKSKRVDWAESLSIPVYSSGADSKRCLFVGCTLAYDSRMQEVARSAVQLLQKANYEFAILGKEEVCCSEFVRKVGEEGLFTELAFENIDLFSKYGIEEVVVICPHGYQTFHQEYGLLEELPGNLKFVHISEVLAELIREGKLNPVKELDVTVTYHDPCYLGRRSGIYDEPREVLRSIPGLKLVEMPRSRENSFCCGGGGGRMWMESTAEEKIAERRILEAESTGAEVVVTACPFCFSNLDDAVKTSGLEEKLRVVDLTELLAQSVFDKDEM